MNCLVCRSKETTSINDTAENKIYHHCPQCDFHFLSPEFRLNESEEKARYLHHENDVSNLHYQKFVQALVTSIQKKMSPDSIGLDYGCGPGPVATHLLKESGFNNIRLYDPFFQKNELFLTDQYDFIFCSEVAEHFFDPFSEFQRLRSLLKPQGILFIYSLFFDSSNESTRFIDWYYRRDPTHVSFYSPKTMSFIAHRFNFSAIEIAPPRLAFMTA